MFDHAKDQPSVQSHELQVEATIAVSEASIRCLLGGRSSFRPSSPALTVAVVIGAVIDFFLVRKS